LHAAFPTTAQAFEQLYLRQRHLEPGVNQSVFCFIERTLTVQLGKVGIKPLLIALLGKRKALGCATAQALLCLELTLERLP
jgi:hypothetical protein